ncbi:ABC transporter ATP-binding protein [Streptomyces physcomitrii]|uniref:ABC transporter ATP-binding protein n=1 Tax=Streptomyces physcomitrii TaxID=2724184 RepID=A0ABX1HA93_9ACTN|nr:ABC transporter ATP-binding protein [Streptomyces physcomitrii]NKI44149.1 ABC transporter ATP-binding protein [Streptomyces physcomitrii]
MNAVAARLRPMRESAAARRSEMRLRRRLAASVRSAGRPLAAAVWAVNLARALSPVAVGLFTGLLVQHLVTSPRDTGGLTRLTLALCVTLLASQSAEILAGAVKFSAARRIDRWHRLRLADLMGAPSGIGHLDDPAVRQELDQAAPLKGLPGWVSYTFGTSAVGQVVISTRTVGACCAALVLACFSWPLALLALAAAMGVRAATGRDWMEQHAVIRGFAPATRRAEYWAEVAASSWSAKEVRVFGLSAWAIGRFREVLAARTDRVARVRLRLLRRLGGAVLVLAPVAALGLGVLAAAGDRLPPGEFALHLGMFWAVLSVSRWDADSYDVQFAGLPALRAVDRLEALLADADPYPSGGLASGAPAAGAPRIRFESVGFAYPGSARRVLDGLDLEIEPGATVALVGVNGAGKSTFTKLLTGLLAPTTGRITVDGVPLEEIAPSAWRARVSVVLQEFVHYELPLSDNVTLGAPGHRPSTEALDRAAREAGTEDLVAAAPLGWETPLARGYPHGIDLSGGQWQRIALARALYAVSHGARLLILDEPTAHLDIRAELELFSRIGDRARDASVLLISHRLATVRRADRIVLLDAGRVAESGTHEELMALGGRYAEMFTLQARRFTEDEADPPGDLPFVPGPAPEAHP